MPVALLALLLVASPPEAAPAPPSLQPLLAEADAAYAVRDEPGKMAEVDRLLGEAEKLSPDDYGLLWREARQLYWRADAPSTTDAEKARLGKRCWDLAQRAVAANPKGAAGWFYAAAGVGYYSLGMGILTALAKGMEHKYTDRLTEAGKLDPEFNHGAVPIAWGRYYFKLPWPKYDAGKSEKWLEEALKQNPNNIRAMVYLAELFDKEGERERAQRAWARAASTGPGKAFDEPEQRRYRDLARAHLASASK